MGWSDGPMRPMGRFRSTQSLSALAASPLPPRLALCLGSELTGASAELLQAADARVYLPLHGFADSLNLSVAGALALQMLLTASDGAAVGACTEEERKELRRAFYPAVARGEAQAAEFAAFAERVNRGDEAAAVPFADLRRPDAHRKDQGATIA